MEENDGGRCVIPVQRKCSQLACRNKPISVQSSSELSCPCKHELYVYTSSMKAGFYDHSKAPMMILIGLYALRYLAT